MPDLAIIVPTRGRPENIRKVISAWDFTNAWDHADLVLVADTDDPEIQGYQDVVAETEHPDTHQPLVTLVEVPEWMPMVHKLNRVAVTLAKPGADYFALGFAGDDHLPQTIGWAARYLTVLRELGTGMVYGDDGYQGAKLSTEWAVTADAVRALGRMVPADVEHMYCDNAMMDLFGEAGALQHLPEVRIEHMHPVAGKAETDAQYQRVNHRDQFRRDRNTYESWKNGRMSEDIAAIKALRRGRAEVRPEIIERRNRMSTGSAPRPAVQRYGTKKEPLRSGPTSMRPRTRRADRLPVPREFQYVQGATPDEIGITLADFASRVPADQEIVELGVFRGRTALLMAWGAGQGNGAHVTGIDPWDMAGNVYDPPFTDAGGRSQAEYNIRSQGYEDQITLIKAFSEEVAERWVTSLLGKGHGGKPVGLLFVDGDHTREGARRDIEAWAPHLAPGAVIAVDDYGHPDWPGVGEAVDELVAEGFLEPIEIHHDRLAVTRLTPMREIDRELDKGAPSPARSVPYEVTESSVLQPTAITSEGVEPAPAAEPQMDPVSEVPEEMTLGQLRAAVREKGIPGAARMGRAELLKILGR